MQRPRRIPLATATALAVPFVALLLIACGDATGPAPGDSQARQPAETEAPAAPPTPETEAAAEEDDSGRVEEAITEERLPPGFVPSTPVEGLVSPTCMAFAPDGRLFVCEQLGTLRVVRDDVLQPEPFVSLDVVHGNERGLLGVAIDPDFARNRYVYLHYIRARGEDFVARVSRFTARADDPDRAEPGSETIVLDDLKAARWHNAGSLRFGPDGLLYVGIGEAGTDYAPEKGPQGLGNLNGKLLRLDVSSLPYSIPPDNPFVADPAARGEIWALGLRNPFGFGVDPVDGRVFVNDVGEDDWEEVNEIQPGANYGWPHHEGPGHGPGFVEPIHTYDHDHGCAITGGTFYRGAGFPSEYQGSYFFVDYCRQWIRRITPKGEIADFSQHPDARGLVALSTSPDGDLYLLINEYDSSTGDPETPRGPSGRVLRIRYAGDAATAAR